MFYVYIIFSKTLDVYYKGFSTDIETRLVYHNSGKSPYTSRANDWELVFSFGFTSKREALVEEKRIKKLNRVSIEKLISKT